jgi:hypothetical protein
VLGDGREAQQSVAERFNGPARLFDVGFATAITR